MTKAKTEEKSAGARLKAYRESQRWSTRAMGNSLNCTHTHVQRMEADEVVPGSRIAVTCARLTGIPVEAWLPKKEKKP